MIIAIDFDGTCVTHDFPKIGKDVGAVPVLKELVENGHKLILWTMRSDIFLQEALNWFDEHGIPLWGVNSNPEQKSWTQSPKAYAELYIDDAALGIPLIHDLNISSREFVDWKGVESLLVKKNIIKYICIKK